MVIVDSHCHVSPYWYEPVESLLFQMDQNGMEKVVLMQYMGQFNNEYQFDCDGLRSIRSRKDDVGKRLSPG